MNSQKVVTPVKTGVQVNRNCLNFLDSGFRRNDDNVHMRTFCETINVGRKQGSEGEEIGKLVECFFSDFEVRRNKRHNERYQLLGTTIGGRKLKIIFQLMPREVVRVITGWAI